MYSGSNPSVDDSHSGWLLLGIITYQKPWKTARRRSPLYRHHSHLERNYHRRGPNRRRTTGGLLPGITNQIAVDGRQTAKSVPITIVVAWGMTGPRSRGALGGNR